MGTFEISNTQPRTDPRFNPQQPTNTPPGYYNDPRYDGGTLNGMDYNTYRAGNIQRNTSMHPTLDPNSPSYNPAMAAEYERAFGFAPGGGQQGGASGGSRYQPGGGQMGGWGSVDPGFYGSPNPVDPRFQKPPGNQGPYGGYPGYTGQPPGGGPMGGGGRPPMQPPSQPPMGGSRGAPGGGYAPNQPPQRFQQPAGQMGGQPQAPMGANNLGGQGGMQQQMMQNMLLNPNTQQPNRPGFGSAFGGFAGGGGFAGSGGNR